MTLGSQRFLRRALVVGVFLLAQSLGTSSSALPPFIGPAPTFIAAKFDVRVMISGMMAIGVKSDKKEAWVLLTNSGAYMPHTPQIVIDCRQLKYRQQCKGGGTDLRIPLDDGWDIELKPTTWSPTALDVDVTLSADMAAIAPGVALKSALLTPGTNPALPAMTSARMRLANGALVAGPSDGTGYWTFREGAYNGTEKKRQQIAESVAYLMADVEGGVTLVLKSLDPANPAKQLEYELVPGAFSREIEIDIDNEPEPADYCAHEPTPMMALGHFKRYYELTDAANPATLALPYPEVAPNRCKQKARWPIVCMSAAFTY